MTTLMGQSGMSVLCSCGMQKGLAAASWVGGRRRATRKEVDLGGKKSRDHVIVSSGWRHTRRVTFPGGARHAATNQHIAPSAPPLDLCQLLKFLLLLTLLLRSCPRPPMILPWKSDFRRTMAVGGVQASVARG